LESLIEQGKMMFSLKKEEPSLIKSKPGQSQPFNTVLRDDSILRRKYLGEQDKPPPGSYVPSIDVRFPARISMIKMIDKRTEPRMPPPQLPECS